MGFMEPITGPYDPKTTEDGIYKLWEESGYFNPDNLPVSKNSKLKTQNYVVYMPLPNVTGTWHMGHALDNTGPDILIRYHRMRGRKTLWLPGTDHAGIATQYVVEKKLKKEGTSRFELGREKFIEEVWKWKNEYGDRIYGQLKKLGVSADWSRVRFTMDEAYALDVKKAFIHYYEKGLLYRGERTVNWCPRCGTSLSDLELEYKEENVFLYYITYGPFTLATTRPETKFGDTGLAVNPKDERYKQYVGKELEIETLSTEGSLDSPQKKKIKITVVADDAVDITFGTGVVKVTPAHDLVDFEIGGRHNLPLMQIIDERGKMNEKVGKYAGMKTEDARKKIVEDLKAVGLLEKTEPYTHNLAVCYRCSHAIEPIPSLQWFLKMSFPEKKGLAEKALGAVDEEKTRIGPENFERAFRSWMGNIKDWTISRQIWWGHQLPVYFCKNKQEEFSTTNDQFSNNSQNPNAKQTSNTDNFIVAIERPETCPVCGKCEMEQSPDVLDTWFSSALWPFAGLSESDRKNYYPGNLVSNAREILNLWDARMIFSGLEFMGEVPFKDVLIHGTILTKDGRRMSKSLGTGIDPLKYVEEFGADATRFAVIWQSSGQDIRWDESAVVAGKKFANKIWNAARFVLKNAPTRIYTDKNGFTQVDLTAEDKQILEKLKTTKEQLERDIESFEFAKALHNLYDFFWHDFCDVYLEESKKQLSEGSENLKTTKEILSHVLFESLKMLHLFLPFVTETIYQKLPVAERKKTLMIEEWGD